MKTIKWSLVLMTICATSVAWAEEEAREDPWEYDKEKDEKREEAEKEEKDAERTFGSSGDFVISAERLFGLASTSTKTTLEGLPDTKDTVMRVNLLTNANQDSLGFSAPRLAFDYFVGDAISLGIALGFSSTADGEKNQYFIASPRVGYAFMFSEMFGIWPRLGATYMDQKVHGSAPPAPAGVYKLGVIAVSAELPLVIVPMPQLAFTIGPTFDGAVYGKINPPGPEIDQSDFAMDEFGGQAALSVFF